ncbi:MAG: hypothetical protein IPJ89_02770 [Candidatus Iainarchaeum archaeon]|uniref:TATA-box-binding protein n=1 Tax=Candidatus Iainarchaeum sp. TaxID=3101447 RepID=A0A7T9DKU3_9ARCH|nr:MAG: hypothetical protein IPJ89_02770 [Candidatus Diapherotrites archaeon]
MSEGSGQVFEQRSFMHKGKSIEYAIVNLVASGGLNANLDLYNLAMSIPNIEYEPEQFPGAILKLKEPKVSMLLFKNGKIICSGASSTSQIDVAIKKANKMIHEIQPKVKILTKIEYEVVNLVATGNLHQNLDLFATAMQLDNVEYEPEQFPGAILRLDVPKLTLLLFKNGKVICAGAKNEAEMMRGLEIADDLVRGLKKGGTKKKVKAMEEEPDDDDDEEMEEAEEAEEEKPKAKVAPAKHAVVAEKAIAKKHKRPVVEEESEEVLDGDDQPEEVNLSPLELEKEMAEDGVEEPLPDDDDEDL